MSARPRNNLLAAPGDTNRKASDNIWSDCPWGELERLEKNGVIYFEDFTKLPFITTAVTTEAVLGNGLKAFGSTATSDILLGGAAEGGIIKLFETDDNEGCSIAQINLPFKVIQTYGSFWFEARVKSSVITDTESGFFCGMMEQLTYTATAPIAAAGTLTDNNFVGFHRLEGDGDQMDTVYKTDGNTQVSNADQLHTALVADTYTKIGMKYDAKDGYFRWYQNGLELATKYALTSTAGNPFPNDVFMGFSFASLNASANDSTQTIDWVKIAQCYEVGNQ